MIDSTSSISFAVFADPDGVLHNGITVAHPILLQDSNVDYEDGEQTLCDRHIGRDWVPCLPGAHVSCVACLGTMFTLVASALAYVGTHTGRMLFRGTKP